MTIYAKQIDRYITKSVFKTFQIKTKLKVRIKKYFTRPKLLILTQAREKLQEYELKTDNQAVQKKKRLTTGPLVNYAQGCQTESLYKLVELLYTQLVNL